MNKPSVSQIEQVEFIRAGSRGGAYKALTKFTDEMDGKNLTRTYYDGDTKKLLIQVGPRGGVLKIEHFN